MMVEKRFGVLRIIAVVLKVLAWIALIGAVVMGIVMISTGGRMGGMEGMQGAGAGLLGGIMMIPFGVLYFVMFYAWAEGILVVLDIEENTRLTNALLQMKPSAAPVAASRPSPAEDATVAPAAAPVAEPAAPLPREPRRPASPPAAPPAMPPG